MNSYGEIGRGRRSSGNDSSSSRESSPVRPAPKRDFSPPNSDDEDGIAQVATNNETPPPQSQPIIRQAMAFGNDSIKAPEVSTYEAAPLPPPKAGIFLPGQQVPVPPKPKAPKPKKPAATGTKRPRKGDAYPGQTSRFRISTYDPTPSSAPPINHGTGPYSSLYRGVTGPLDAGRQDPPAVVSANGGYPSTSAAPLVPINAPRHLPPAPSNTMAPVMAQSSVQHARPPSNGARRPAPHHSEDHGPPTQRNYQSQHYNASPPPSTADSSSSYTLSSSTPAGAYYRRNYEADVWEHESSESHLRHRGRTTNSSQLLRSSSRYRSRDTESYGQDVETHRRSKFPTRMITLLIQDVRSGTTDHQLAEVKVPLRPGSSAEDGFWADARDISEQLQRGPSRIDGPARAYTLRGKYRQFVLRVSADNVDEFLSANVIIQPDKTLDLIVEMLYPPGVPPIPPRVPTDSWSSGFDEFDRNTPSDRMDVDSRKGTPPPRGLHREMRDSRKRMNSPSFDDYDGPEPTTSPHPVANKVARRDYAWETSQRQGPRHTSPHSSNHSSFDSGLPSRKPREPAREIPARQMSNPPEFALPRRPPPSPSPQLDASPEPADKFMMEVEKLVQKEDHPGFLDFFRANAGTKHSDVLRQYTFILKLIKGLVGRKIPGFENPIEEVHIIQAMRIEDVRYLSTCKETMHLMDLYGEKAVHYYDPKVAALVEDAKPIPYNVDPRVKILQFLQEIDDAWHNGRKEKARPQSSPSSPEENEAPMDEPSRRGQRSSKGMFVA
ncbi:hypothetical protein CPB84DRAFT_1782751 [Gymnopilus junonius]|uniref:Uncharacterized protein n=1 Tax=Gymnopilus junonius TaxID=109634 RepID=A0A9P5NIB8_GYMJU|nr:hypothetical protein CPB84DRAFT_1782751 [Gymnopilus junonius]